MTRAIDLHGPPAFDFVEAERQRKAAEIERDYALRRERDAMRELSRRVLAMNEARNQMGHGPPRPLTARDAYAEELRARNLIKRTEWV